MTDRLREPLGVLAGLAILLLLVVACNDDVGSTSPRFLSAPGTGKPPAPPSLSTDASPWEPLSLTLENPWTPVFDPTQAGASVATAVAAPESPPAPHRPRAKSRGLFSWLRNRRPEPRGNTSLERVAEPPAPDSLKRSSRGLQFGLRF